MGCSAGSLGVKAGMHMNGICSDGNVDRNRYAQARSCGQDALVCKRKVFVNDGLADGFAQAGGILSGLMNGVIQKCAGFVCHSKTAVADGCGYIFGCLTYHGQFQIVNNTGSVHSYRGNNAALHKVYNNRVQAHFGHMGSHCKNNCFLLLKGCCHGSYNSLEAAAGKYVGQAVKKILKTGPLLPDFGKIRCGYFAFSF